MGKTILKDALTGQLYELVDLPPGKASWMFAPHLLYECGSCRKRFKAKEPPGLCSNCRATLSKRHA